MKKIVGLVVILAALVLGGYYAMGVVTEKTLKKNIVMINQSSGLLVDVDHYDRGWFTSSALLNWQLHTPEHKIKDQNGQEVTVSAHDYHLQMPLSIHHGPVIYADSHVKFALGYAHSDLTLPKEYADKLSSMVTKASVMPQLKLTIYVTYLNKTHIQLDSPPFKLIGTEGNNQFEIVGMKSDVNISSGLETVDGNLAIDGASFIKNQMKALLGKVTSDYKLHRTDTGLYLGEASLSLPSLVITENAQQVFALDKFDAHSKSDITAGLFESHFNVSLAKMMAQGKVYGPAVLEMSLTNLDAEVLAKINDDLNQMQQAQSIERQQALFTLLPQLPKLLGKGAHFEISKLSVVLPAGTIEGNLTLSLPKGDAGNPFQLMQKIQGHGQVKIPVAVMKSFVKAAVKQKLLSQPTLQQAMVKQIQQNDEQAKANSTSSKEASEPALGGENKPLTPAEAELEATRQTDSRLAAMVQAGLLSLKGADYVIDVNLTQGQLSINDQPFNPAMMQF